MSNTAACSNIACIFIMIDEKSHKISRKKPQRFNIISGSMKKKNSSLADIIFFCIEISVEKLFFFFSSIKLKKKINKLQNITKKCYYFASVELL